jgi:RimJ/RimL family protein N-acetyltransferase
VTTTARGEGLAPVTLRGDHVRLVPLTRDHLDALVAVGLDPDLWALTGSQVRGRDDLARWVTTALAEQDAGTALPFVTTLAADGTVVGATRFGNWAPAHRRVEIGWTWVARPWQRTAVNTEAKLLMLRHAFEGLGCQRVELKTDLLNERSQQAMLRLGATREGVLRRHMVTESGRIRDTVYFSVIAEEWPVVEAGLIARLGIARA